MQSYSLSTYSEFENAVNSPGSWENKLYKSYSEHIHMLFINKKIQSEADYMIYNTKKIAAGDEVVLYRENCSEGSKAQVGRRRPR